MVDVWGTSILKQCCADKIKSGRQTSSVAEWFARKSTQQHSHESVILLRQFQTKKNSKDLRAVTLKPPRIFFVLRTHKQSRFNPSGKP